jgi:hypothetical protein
MGGIKQGEETKNLNVVDVSLYRNEYRNLKLAWATMERGGLKRIRGVESTGVIIHIYM